jgi:hypothetical protein
MDFRDLGGVPADAGQMTAPMDFSDLGGVTVKDDEGALAAAGRGALRNIPLAQQAAAALAPVNPMSEKKTYSDELQHLTDAAESAKAAHPVAYGAGAVGGAAAPLLVPGIGEALEAAPILGNAALGGAQAVSDTSLTRDPGKAAKEAAIGAGIGGALGKLGNWVGKTVPTETEAANGAVAQKLGIPGRRLANAIGPNFDEDLAEIGNTIRVTKLPDGRSLNDLSDSPERFAHKVGDALDMYGKKIGEIADSVDANMPSKPLLDTISDMATGNNGLAVRNEFLDKINQIIKTNADKNGELSFGKLRDLTNHIYKNMVLEDPQTGSLLPGSEKALEAWRFLRGLQNDIVQTTKPKLFPAFQEANRHYSNLVGIRKALEQVALRQDAKQITMGGLANPLSWGTRLGEILGAATGLNRINNVPFAAVPKINAVRGLVPKNIPQAELSDFLTKKYGAR